MLQRMEESVTVSADAKNCDAFRNIRVRYGAVQTNDLSVLHACLPGLSPHGWLDLPPGRITDTVDRPM